MISNYSVLSVSATSSSGVSILFILMKAREWGRFREEMESLFDILNITQTLKETGGGAFEPGCRPESRDELRQRCCSGQGMTRSRLMFNGSAMKESNNQGNDI